jgi:ribonuclease Z
MTFSLTILGCGAALPTRHRHASAHILAIYNNLYLIDCGEGTQLQMEKYSIKRGKIRHIFISHLHGDHVFGLIGLLTSFSLMGRKDKLTIFSPEGLEEMIRLQLRVTHSHLTYTLHFVVVDTEVSQLICEDGRVAVYSIPLKHRVPTTGYLFREKVNVRSMLPEKIVAYNIPYTLINGIKEGADYTLPSGEVIQNEMMTIAPPMPRSFAYCSDTIYNEAIIPIIKNVDLLYHEATYCQDRAAKAPLYMHSTAQEAARIAKAANVKHLIIGHYSSIYDGVEQFLVEAGMIFEKTMLAEEGKIYNVELLKA